MVNRIIPSRIWTLLLVFALAAITGCDSPIALTDPNGPSHIRHSGPHSPAMQAIIDNGAFTIGGQRYDLDDIREVYEWLLVEPDTLHYRVDVAGDLPPDRLLYLVVTTGRPTPTPPPGNLNRTQSVFPRIDTEAALSSDDPWLIAGALFAARKQNRDIAPSQILEIWSKAKNWDHICTDQALLYLAGSDSDEIAALIANPEAPEALERLVLCEAENSELAPWLFRSSEHWSPDLQLMSSDHRLSVVIHDQTMEVIGSRPVELVSGILSFDNSENFVSFSYQNGQMHGRSRFVSPGQGPCIRLAVPVRGGV